MLDTVGVSIELFGTARIACGSRELQILAPKDTSICEIVEILARACPSLVGIALREDLAGLLESYTLNLNATEFVEGDELTLRNGDTLLLFSSLAGG